MRKQAAADEFEARRVALLPVMQQDIDAVMADISTMVTLSVGQLQDILKYYFLSPTLLCIKDEERYIAKGSP